MSYATLTHLIDRFGEKELTELAGRSDICEIDPEPVARALEDADSEINGYLAVRYSVPVQILPSLTVPGVVVRLACDMARYRLYLYAGSVPESVQTAYDNAIKLLRDLAAGKADLGVNPAPTGAGAASVVTPGARVFSRSNRGPI